MKPVLLLLLLLGGAAMPAAASTSTCEITVSGDDTMRFDTRRIEVSRQCETFTVHLRHTGRMPKIAMGHNWVLSTAADMPGIAADGLAAGVANDYLKPGDTRIIARTRMLGGGESDSVAFPVSRLQSGTPYRFFCSFTGHFATMQGMLIVL